jgi:hypothetical protein
MSGSAAQTKRKGAPRHGILLLALATAAACSGKPAQRSLDAGIAPVRGFTGETEMVVEGPKPADAAPAEPALALQAEWVTAFGSGTGHAIDGFALAGSDVVVTGSFTISLGDGKDDPLRALTSTASSDDAFLLRLSPSGERRFWRRFGGPEHDAAGGVAELAGDLLFVRRGSQKKEDGSFLTRVAADGKPRAERFFPGVDLTHLILLAGGDVVVAGTGRRPNVNLGGGDRACGEGRSLVAARLRADGAHVWSRCAGASMITIEDVAASGDEVVLCGWFRGRLELGPAPLTTNSGPATATGSLLARLAAADGKVIAAGELPHADACGSVRRHGEGLLVAATGPSVSANGWTWIDGTPGAAVAARALPDGHIAAFLNLAVPAGHGQVALLSRDGKLLGRSRAIADLHWLFAEPLPDGSILVAGFVIGDELLGVELGGDTLTHGFVAKLRVRVL